jgi:hypothetical protein
MVSRAVLAVLLLFGAVSRSVSAGGPVSATDAARLWLRALHDGSVETLASLTTLPFGYRETWPKKQCARVAKDVPALRKWLGCMRKKEDLLIEELLREKNDPSHVRLVDGIEGASKKLRDLAKAAPGKSRWVNGYINGDGVTYEFLFAIDGDDESGRRVSSMYIDASFDSG